MKLSKRDIDLNRVIWQIRLYAISLGWLGGVGVILISSSLLVAALVLLPLREDIQSIQANAKSLQESIEQRSDTKSIDNPATQLGTFYNDFPGSNTIADALQSIYATAASNKISLNQGDYSLVELESGLLQRYEISLPLRARYTQVRNFIGQVLAEQKNVALVGVTLTRSAVTDADIDAQLRFSVYVKDAP